MLELKGTENAGETAATAAAVIENLEQAKTGLAACGKKLTEYKEKLGQTEDPVAKAELKATIDALESKIAELEGTISRLQAAIKEKGINTVSYTHLDVYKRQAQRRPPVDRRLAQCPGQQDAVDRLSQPRLKGCLLYTS